MSVQLRIRAISLVRTTDATASAVHLARHFHRWDNERYRTCLLVCRWLKLLNISSLSRTYLCTVCAFSARITHA